MKSKKIILLTLLLSLTACGGETSSTSNSSSVPVTGNLMTESPSTSQVSTSTVESSSIVPSSNTIEESSSISSSSMYEEKTLVINSKNFNTLSVIDLNGVVEEEDAQYRDIEFAFNSNATLKSNKIHGIKDISIHIYQTYDNLDLFTNYNGTGSAVTENKTTGNKEMTYTYSFSQSINEFCIKNTSTTHRTHVYSITITYTGVLSSGGNNSSSSSSSSSSSNSSSNKPSSSSSSSSSSSNTQLSGSYAGTYYASLSTTTNGQTLVKELNKIISSNTKDVGYGGLKEAYKTTDVKPGTNIIWDMYSNCSYTAGSSFASSYNKEGDGYNREHSIPQSWFNEASPMKADLFHVYPTDAYVNNRRGSYPFGEVSNATYTSGNGSKVGSSANSLYSGTVFEPIDEYKGDFARTYFYMATRYMSQLGSWTKGEAQKVFSGSYPYLTAYSVDLFTKWAEQDPVSQKEIDRNNAVYSLQKNRNPYIDHPEFVEIIWG